MARYVSYRDFDWVLLVFVLDHLRPGRDGDPQRHRAHQVRRGAYQADLLGLAGVGVMFLVSLINYQALLEQIHWFYIAAVGA